MPFISGPDGDLKTAFVSDSWLLDQFVGNTLFVWGINNNGQLGDNTAVSKSNPVQTVTGGINWKQVSCGYFHMSVIKTDGTLWGWGLGTSGQLGDNTISSKSSPVQTVTFGANWKQVSSATGFMGFSHTAAIKTDGTLWAWGNNASGQLGDNTTTRKSSPVQTVAFGTNWKQVSCGDSNMAAIKTDGSLWCWGSNYTGNLGNNTTTNISSPVQTTTYGTNWKQVSAGNGHTTAIKMDGTLWCWGANTNGQLGDNTTTNRSSPVQTVTFGTNWKSVSAGYYYTASIKNDGTVWIWGRNNNGQIGDNTLVYRSSPVQTIAGGTNWKQVSCGTYFTAAIKTDGTLWTWGRNYYGQLGNNTITNISSPVQTTTYGTNWKQVSCGDSTTVAVTNGDL